ncbi:hypothetical protein BDD43_1290 [Mucilaginibacter gracilis]|uniref:Uncharacterized protein n=1 Tax=Mucilaginibacter gracilis TaxID=423350 RepID=A0A495IWM6_9SPHI|nr:hypothetical protein [Mucilaginibacter gracilis]RKR81146.1 hypothetical protein BDD43_1290 [Mucilaginibacter gracilis]
MAQIVDAKPAAECVLKYQYEYQEVDNPSCKEAYTSAVSFPIESILAFIKSQPDCDTLTIVPGIYTQEFAKQYDGAKEGRMSLFLYLESSKGHGGGLGNPVPPTGDPFNLGSSQP